MHQRVSLHKMSRPNHCRVRACVCCACACACACACVACVAIALYMLTPMPLPLSIESPCCLPSPSPLSISPLHLTLDQGLLATSTCQYMHVSCTMRACIKCTCQNAFNTYHMHPRYLLHVTQKFVVDKWHILYTNHKLFRVLNQFSDNCRWWHFQPFFYHRCKLVDGGSYNPILNQEWDGKARQSPG